MILIGDPDDPRVSHYREVRERDLAGRKGLFVAEGIVVVRVLLSGRSRFAAESLLLSEPRATALAPWLGTLDPGLPVHVASPAVMDRIAGFPIHRGVLAVGRRRSAGGFEDAVPVRGPALVVAAIGLANHDNVGAIFRNAAAFGAAAVLLDRGSCDPLYRKAIRVSAGAVLTVPFGRGGSAAAMVDGLEQGGFEVVALSPGGSRLLRDVEWPARTAILVGSEGHGLPDALLGRLRPVRIDMAGGTDSLNVAAATAIALHAARSGRSD